MSEISLCEALGVSVVVCTHNGATRLPSTITHLANQRVAPGLPWEVVLVDNASTDASAVVAHEHWKGRAVPELRVVQEPVLGLSRARECGFSAARFGVISFVDDDNWVDSDWVRNVHTLMATNADVGACGGVNEPVFDTEPPFWFKSHAHMFAATGGGNGKAFGITESLPGAGLSVRASAWQDLRQKGFAFTTPDRRGNALTSSGDIELGLALRLAGWNLWRDKNLRLCHFMPAERVHWRYLRRLYRGVGVSSVDIEPYSVEIRRRMSGKCATKWSHQRWVWQSVAELRNIMRHPLTFVKSLISEAEGDDLVLRLEASIGRLIGLLNRRTNYDRSFDQISSANWAKKMR